MRSVRRGILRGLIVISLSIAPLAAACGDDGVDDNAGDAAPSHTGGEPGGPEVTGPHTGGPGSSATETNVAPIRDAGSDCPDDDCDAGG
jgi:hypothetical protein